ncbi:hypothetical protein DPMN_054801 [Dreissena polymorpha]|uniref:Mutator-like transposase domain-containing protein n=1 Tax=Dreissena polymorpha TaxID=45954 RepID=A0A9D4CNS4_DREPO|nr:hypothetical protein DPMN_054801 [Dreissena polymorpha]
MDLDRITERTVQRQWEKWTWKSGIPCFVVNTKLGTAMVNSLGGPSRVNNMLSTLNLKTISDTNLKIMEQPAGEVIEQVATESLGLQLAMLS